ncbi:lipolytic protein G-D-S-L family [Gillisia limnaea]|uniref:Lipolytic protein G-D-S-L family n=1 Tax=Gillisia limnaea (strain DSM 15749 / LMG 21470 / R-8282) TaxID=865937 RepID=H2BZ00_GILLR|nr:lipolytic protein G-D-S-L family [Gillisia limnaea]EHQ03345.1 lipolytic protein G-D-S-L family [Gillisia limnaea DSM 15749]
MKNYIKFLPFLAMGFLSCEPELDNPIDEADFYTAGEADFSNYVALGNSLTAGYADGALYITGQENSYPNIMAQQFAKVQVTNDFTQPLMADNAGGLLLGGTQILSNRRVLAVGANGNPSPQIYSGMLPTTDITNVLSGPFNNLGVPGAKSYHLGFQGYGNIAGVPLGTANPYFVRFASAPQATVIEDALAQNPTFFSLWIGNNDVLGYATNGGAGVDQTGNLDPGTYGANDITDPNVFASVYSSMVTALITNGADGVLMNIPDVTTIPYFTTIPNNALVLDTETAANLTGFFQAVAGIFAQGAIRDGASPQQAQALAAQYAISFSAGPNRFLIDVPVSQMNPLGFRQMTEEELLVLTINQQALTQGYGSVVLTPEVMQVLGLLQQGGQPTPEQAQLVLNAVSGIDDKDALDNEEIENIAVATAAYNATIKGLAQEKGLAFVDIRALINQLANGGIAFDAGTINATFVTGGAFSLDGVHATPRGYAAIANAILESINTTYGSTVPKVNIGNYGTVTLSNDVQ